MLVTLIGKDCVHKIVLPKEPLGSYWISDKSGENERKLINIEEDNGKWQIVSNNYLKIIKANYINFNSENINIELTKEKIAPKAILHEYSMYCVYLGNSDEMYILYCSPVYEKDIIHLDIKNTSEILIGKDKNNHICYNHVLIKNNHARIFSNNGKWNVENFDKRYSIFINDLPVYNDVKPLNNGDVIFIMGLKIIIIGNSIYINNPLKGVTYNEKNLTLVEDEKLDGGITKSDENEDTNEEEIYIEQNYFSRAPRIVNKIETEKINIDAPPAMQDKNEMPAILVLGSTLSMGIMMIVSVFMTVDGLINKTASAKDTAFQLIISLAMLVSMILFPILSMKWEKKQKIKYENTRRQRYIKYLNSKIVTINEIMSKQKKALIENYVSAETCEKIILEKSPRLWERKVEESDFLKLRLGTGKVPLKIDIEYPRESFSMEDDDLVEKLNQMAKNSKFLENAPVSISLVENNISSLIVSNNTVFEKYMKNIILQLIALHSYEDLKLVFLLKKDESKKWEYLKMLPHIWDNTKQIRFFADEYSDMKEVSKYLEEEFQDRNGYDETTSYKDFMPYYLIITDDYKKIANLKIITEILKTKRNIGFSLLCITNDLTQLPNDCRTFISIEEKTGRLFESELTTSNQKQFSFDISKDFDFENITKIISNIPIRYSNTGSMLLPNSYAFLEMYDAGRIEQLNVMERWKKNDSTLSLKAPIGIDSAGMPIVLDVHEKFHGPHGLIAGSTGSGKSEFIITYILSLAINYHPDDVNFVLIDYKGGGLAGAFKKRDVKLPHLVGTITNIDTVGLQRSLDSIQSELRKRQIQFNEARNMTDESTIDIYKYQKLYHEGIVKKPIPHLFIICDEFAELKQQQQEFMDELISVARIGRSLGVHLILATQKPAGIVNEQIRSNSKFGICLKVQDKEDSIDVIKRPDAASLKGVGQFYIQVGNDEYFALGQSAWSGAPYFPSNITKKKIDNSIEFISNIGVVIRKLDDSLQKVVSNKGDQLTNIIQYVDNLAKINNIKEEQLWLDTIPETIYIKQLREKYKIQTKENEIDPVIGEYDDPFNQRQGVVTLDISKEGNTIIYGNADSGKETLLSTIIYDTITTHSAKEVQFYILDFGSEALKIYKRKSTCWRCSICKR